MLLIISVLIVFIAVQGLSTVSYSQEKIKLTYEVHQLKIERDKLNSKWTQLLLTQKTLLNNHMIERAIKNGLNMTSPASAQIVYLD